MRKVSNLDVSDLFISISRGHAHTHKHIANDLIVERKVQQF